MENHVAVPYKNGILIHGGGDRYGKIVKNACLFMEAEEQQPLRVYKPELSELSIRGSPFLSCHAASAYNGSVLLSGGFNGEARCNDIYLLEGDAFIKLRNTGNLPLTGRSAHIELQLSESRLVIIGREVGQRRWTEISLVEIEGNSAFWHKPQLFPLSVSNECYAEDEMGNFIIFGGRKSSDLFFFDKRTLELQNIEVSKHIKGRSGAAAAFFQQYFIVVGGLIGTVENTDSIMLIEHAFSKKSIRVYNSLLKLPHKIHNSKYFEVDGALYLIGGCYGDTTRGRLATPENTAVYIDLMPVIDEKIEIMNL